MHEYREASWEKFLQERLTELQSIPKARDLVWEVQKVFLWMQSFLSLIATASIHAISGFINIYTPETRNNCSFFQ